MAVLLDGYLRLNYDRPDDPHNDHLIFSKGHASPLYYSMLKAAGAVSEDEFRPDLRFLWPGGPPSKRTKRTVSSTVPRPAPPSRLPDRRGDAVLVDPARPDRQRVELPARRALPAADRHRRDRSLHRLRDDDPDLLGAQPGPPQTGQSPKSPVRRPGGACSTTPSTCRSASRRSCRAWSRPARRSPSCRAQRTSVVSASAQAAPAARPRARLATAATIAALAAQGRGATKMPVRVPFSPDLYAGAIQRR